MNGHFCCCREVISLLKELKLICTAHTHTHTLYLQTILFPRTHIAGHLCDCFSLISCYLDVGAQLPAQSADLSAQWNSRFGGGDGELPERVFGLKN